MMLLLKLALVTNFVLISLLGLIVDPAFGHNIFVSSAPLQQPLWSYQSGAPIESISISSDGNYIAVGSADNSVYLFNKDSNIPLWIYQAQGNISSISMSLDGNYIAAVDGYKIYLFSRSSNLPIWSYQTALMKSVSISSKGDYIAGGGDALYLFKKEENVPLLKYPAKWGVLSVSISGDGSYVATQFNIQPLIYSHYHPVDSLFLFSRENILWGYPTGGVQPLSISRDGNYIISGGEGLWLFNKDNNTPIWSYQLWRIVQSNHYVIIHRAPAKSVSISSDGGFIAAGGEDKRVCLFSRYDNTPLWSYKTGGCVSSVSISSDGGFIAAGGADNSVYLLCKDENAPLWTYQTGGSVSSVSISSDGNYIAAGGHDNRVYLFSRQVIREAERIDLTPVAVGIVATVVLVLLVLTLRRHAWGRVCGAAILTTPM